MYLIITFWLCCICLGVHVCVVVLRWVLIVYMGTLVFCGRVLSGVVVLDFSYV